MAIRITCIKKDNGFHENPYAAISEIGWINVDNGNSGKSTRIQVYDWIKTGGIAYVTDSRGNTAKLICVETEKGTKYVKTESDNVETDNLLKLDECK
jgi:hypothetical protein